MTNKNKEIKTNTIEVPKVSVYTIVIAVILLIGTTTFTFVKQLRTLAVADSYSDELEKSNSMILDQANKITDLSVENERLRLQIEVNNQNTPDEKSENYQYYINYLDLVKAGEKSLIDLLSELEDREILARYKPDFGIDVTQLNTLTETQRKQSFKEEVSNVLIDLPSTLDPYESIYVNLMHDLVSTLLANRANTKYFKELSEKLQAIFLVQNEERTIDGFTYSPAQFATMNAEQELKLFVQLKNIDHENLPYIPENYDLLPRDTHSLALHDIATSITLQVIQTYLDLWQKPLSTIFAFHRSPKK